jgi:hypothetical protein
MRIDSSGNLSFNSGYGSVATAYGCRAWVNFDGTTASPSTIRASGNVTSITKNGTGDYTVNFTNAMPDANFAVAGWARCSGALGTLAGVNNASLATTSARVGTYGISFSTTDAVVVTVAIFR